MGDLFEFLLVAVPISAVLGGGFYAVRHKINSLRIALAKESGANQTAKIATEKSALEDRVRVLERIITDRGYTLSEEIEALRDAPSMTARDNGVPLNMNTNTKA